MKKVFLSLLISLIALTVSAQIQRSFLGCTLTSSYQEVKDHLTQEKYDIGSDDDIFFVYNTKFAGFDCEWIAFEFYKSKLIAVTINYESSYIKRNLLKTLDILADKLDNKYSSFKVLNLEEMKVYMDDKTKCYLSIAGNGSMCLSMRYKDEQLSDEEQAENDSEL